MEKFRSGNLYLDAETDWPVFTWATLRKPWVAQTIEIENLNDEEPMPLSGEAIRLMNYVDDVTVTLRRVLALAQTLTPEERKRVSEYLKNAQPSVETVVSSLQGK
jgi:hypothetical protein